MMNIFGRLLGRKHAEYREPTVATEPLFPSRDAVPVKAPSPPELQAIVDLPGSVGTPATEGGQAVLHDETADVLGESRPEAAVEELNVLISQSRWSDALHDVERAVAQYPGHKPLLILGARIARHEQDWHAADRYARELRRCAEDEMEGYEFGLTALYHLQNAGEFERLAHEALKRFPSAEWALRDVSWALQTRGDWEALVEMAARHRSELPTSITPYRFGTYALQNLNRFEEALVLAREGIERFSDQEWLLVLGCQLANRCGHSDDFLALFGLLLNRFPESAALTELRKFEARHRLGEQNGAGIAEGADSAARQGRPEAVRLLVWDLDETFWKGTLAEGGIEEYVEAHHNIVIELARRGIMSSICSKNDIAIVEKILTDKGIWEYFVFPSIAWESKGPRLRALVDAVQLRPETIMFIDDNANNRGEARAMVPGLQVEDESFIPKILSDVRFKGKDDAGLKRLAQYKLLETRKRDQEASAGSNQEFLRGCDIQVLIDYDVERPDNLDRAIELINRTNQLNYTKRRLSENIQEARERLVAECRTFDRQAGLVRVRDKYGDYGYVGFFLLLSDIDKSASLGGPGWIGGDQGKFRRLLHFCFSCRTLGMQVERWVYEHLGRPRLFVSGEVLTDLSVPADIDWITLVPSMAERASEIEILAPEIRLFGGCEMHALSVYLEAYAPTVRSTGNFTANGVFYRINSAVFASRLFGRVSKALADEVALLGGPVELLAGDYFQSAPPGSAFVFAPGLDAERPFFLRHRVHGWELHLTLKNCERLDVVNATDVQVQERLDADTNMRDSLKQDIMRVARHLRQNYTNQPRLSDQDREAGIIGLIEAVPPGSRLIFLLDHVRMRPADGVVRDDPPRMAYNDMVRTIAKGYSFVGVACFSDVVVSDDQVQMHGNHYERSVYLSMAERIIQQLKDIPCRAISDAPMSIAAE